MPLPVRGDERADGDGSLQPLLYIQVAGGLIEHKTARGILSGCVCVFRMCDSNSLLVVSSHVSLLDTDNSAGKSLQLSSRQILHISLPQVSEIYATTAQLTLTLTPQLKTQASQSLLPSCWQMISCVSVSSFLVRMAPTDPCR